MINDFTLEEKIEIVSENLIDKSEEELCEEYDLTPEEFREILNEFLDAPKDSELYYIYQIGINEKKLNNYETAIRMYRQTMSYVIMNPGKVGNKEIQRIEDRTKHFELEAAKQREVVEKLKKEYENLKK